MDYFTILLIFMGLFEYRQEGFVNFKQKISAFSTKKNTFYIVFT